MSALTRGVRSGRTVIAALLCAAAVAGIMLPAGSSFHTFQLNELYSNASGTVQFIELKEAFGADGQQFLGGHVLSVSHGTTTHSFTFPNDLPTGNTAGHYVLIATTEFALLGIVAPDYIVPAGFLFTNAGTINYASVDSVTYAALPIDGVSSIDRNGALGVNSPTNFAGQSGSISAPPPPPQAAPFAVPTLRYGAVAALGVLLFAAAWRSRRGRNSNQSLVQK